MENASKALIMAGGMFVSIIVLSLLAYMFANMASISKQLDVDLEKNDTLKFNSYFDKYIGRNDITPYEVLSLINLVNHINKEEKKVQLDGITIAQINLDKEKFLSSGSLYKCEASKIEYSKFNGKITKIKISKN